MSSRLDRITDWTAVAQRTKYEARQLAKECGVSLRQLQRYWRKNFQTSPETWLHKLRIDDSKRLLNTGLTIKETAATLGFKQTSHFCRQFKEHNGTTPGNFAIASDPGNVALK